MKLTVLNVPFPFAPVTADPVGGAEQVVAALNRELVARGHRSIVIGHRDSRIAGELIALPPAPQTFNDFARVQVQRELREVIARVLANEQVDLVHLHGIDFENYLPPAGVPTLCTLHTPLAWYAHTALHPRRPLTRLQPVSVHQARCAPGGVVLLPPIENGVAANPFALRVRKRGFALTIGRICPEKGFHEAIDAANPANITLLIAGQVFHWPEHRAYFESRIRPRLNARVRYIGALAGMRKRGLLAAARCVLIPSRAPETSSLVAMEALAAGTPVIAYRSGALPEIIEHGVTGFLVDDAHAMAEAIARCGEIDPATCVRRARERFPLARTLDAYLDLYRRLARESSRREAQSGIRQSC
ncbi:MAG TPA: glycosyltransferase [Rhodanobacteraceae bacterium]|nr:glycosyltransferase [Rhodanobacteraceae bacterium]